MDVNDFNVTLAGNELKGITHKEFETKFEKLPIKKVREMLVEQIDGISRRLWSNHLTPLPSTRVFFANDIVHGWLLITDYNALIAALDRNISFFYHVEIMM